MTRWEAFVALADRLRAGLVERTPVAPGANIRWDYVIEASSYHFVTPALAWCLRDVAGVPPEIRDYLDAALALNGERNRRLVTGLVRIAGALNAIGIEPILLKGASRLVDGTYPTPGLRFLGDLDVLVPAGRASEADAALRRNGFAPAPGIVLDATHHHLPMLIDPDLGAGVELHTALAQPPQAAIVPATWVAEKSTAAMLGGARVRLLEPTRTVAHIVVHDQRGGTAARAQLRQLLDLSLVRTRHEPAIAWGELDDRFCAAGRGQALATYLELDRELLGQPLPLLRSAPRPDTRAAFRASVEARTRRNVWNLAGVALDYFNARRHDPLGVLRLFLPRTWPRGMRFLRTALGRAKW